MTITKDMIGCHVDSHHGIYMGEQIQKFAIEQGMNEGLDYIPAHHDKCHEEGTPPHDTDDHLDWYVDSQDKAEEFLNDQTDIPYVYWGTSEQGDWGLWPNINAVETLGTGEWGVTDDGYVVHINDHGNVTLYEIGDEIWSVV